MSQSTLKEADPELFAAISAENQPRGFKAEEAVITANLIADVLDQPHDAATLSRVRAEVSNLVRRFPVYARPAN